VGTAVAGFVGTALKDKAFVGQARGFANYRAFVTELHGRDEETGVDKPYNDLSAGVRGFFRNGGAYCYVVNVGKSGKVEKGLDALRAIDEVAIVAAPGRADQQSWKALIDHCQLLKDRVAILDPPAAKDVKQIKDLATFGAAGDAPGTVGPTGSSYAAFYYPRVKIYIDDNKEPVTICPSGHLAGAWARTDYARGVHKAPANIPLADVVQLEHYLSRAEQGQLNEFGVNCIRAFADRGILVWGARTRGNKGEHGAYMYLPVRRLVNQIKESIEEGTRWVVFEPNNESLWASIRRDVGAFLRGMWRSGALQGTTEEEAFFVQCDSETNPQDEIDAGKVHVRIGIAPVKPAEFVIFDIGHMSATS